MRGRLSGMSDMPPEDPRISDDPEDDQKHTAPDPSNNSEPDDPDAPAPFTGPYA
jgi:hypothetical protein